MMTGGFFLIDGYFWVTFLFCPSKISLLMVQLLVGATTTFKGVGLV